MSLIRSNLKRELFTLSMLRYNMKINEFFNRKKYYEFSKQVDLQEYYLFRKHYIFPGYKSNKNIILSLNHLSNVFHNPNSPYTVYNNGFIFLKEERVNEYIILNSNNIKFPMLIDNFSYCNVTEEEYRYLELHFLLFKTF